MPRDAICVRILPRRTVVIDGRTRGEGWEGDVPSTDAQTLIADGYAETADKPRRARKASRTKLASAARKPVTVEALDDGTAERG